ncbi:MAG: Sec-independent protein translocase protein TatB [Gammaproteobacteria bacterium]|jgi:sec-independent protein translocase protein TatB
MFDIGFWELVIIALVALLIVGPERLPELAQNAGRIIKKVRSFIQSTKREVEKELKLDQINDLNESINKVGDLMNQAPDKFVQQRMQGLGDQTQDK